MFDQIIANFWFNKHRERFKPPVNVGAHDIKKKFFYKENSSVLKIVIPARGESMDLGTRTLAKNLLRAGSSCLVYEFPWYILCSDAELVIKIFNLAKEQVNRDIIELKKKYNFEKIDLIGPSLGSITAFLVANGNPDVTGIYMIGGGSCLAGCLWEGIRTQKLKNIYLRQGISKDKLIKLWACLASENNISNLTGKKIYVALSKADKVVPYHYGKDLANILQEKYPQTVVEENKHLGHYLTIVKYLFFSNDLNK